MLMSYHNIAAAIAIDLYKMKDYPFSSLPSASGDQIKKGIIALPKNNLINKLLFSDDTEFDWLRPKHFQLLSPKCFTPVSIAQKATEFLSLPNTRVLYIGSGAGKFCLAAGYHFPKTFFYGVEQRHELHHLAENINRNTDLPNVNFIYGNVTQINFKGFDHFYFIIHSMRILIKSITLMILSNYQKAYITTIPVYGAKHKTCKNAPGHLPAFRTRNPAEL
jgi:hypothetical protein